MTLLDPKIEKSFTACKLKKLTPTIGFFLGIFGKICPFEKNMPICKNGHIEYAHFCMPIILKNPKICPFVILQEFQKSVENTTILKNIGL